MKKVLLCANITQHIKAFHVPYMKWFKEQGYEVHVATGDAEGVEYCDVKHVITMSRSPWNPKNVFGYRQLKSIIDRERFSLIDCHTPMGGVMARLAAREARRTGTKVIYTAHGFHFWTGAPLLNWLFYYPVEKWLSRHADCLITICLEDYTRAVRNHFQTREICKIDGIGVELGRFKPIGNLEKKELRKRFGFDENDFILVYVAEISHRKNQEFLLQIAHTLRKEMADLKVLIIGGDSLNGKCQALASKLGLDKCVTFFGRRDDVNRLLGLGDIYVSTSRQEGQGINIIEGMATGLPVCATKIRGHLDLIKDGENGCLVKLGNVTEFAQRISTLRSNRLVADRIVQNAFSQLGRYEKARILNDLSAIYRKYLCNSHD